MPPQRSPPRVEAGAAVLLLAAATVSLAVSGEVCTGLASLTEQPVAN